MGIKPHDFRAEAHGPDPEALRADVLAVLAQPTSSVEEEIAVLAEAHRLLAEALQ